VYDRVTARVGEAAVALLTGEEKRIPARPRYWICTVEAMPPDLGVDFVAIDEIQLSGHRERGHVFTDRLLHARGRHETLLLGAATMRPLVERLVPHANIERQARLSTLTSAGSLAFGALPPRTAVVAFSAARVYELADRLRGRRGGAAVVLGALSPRARNAQVALYQSGEVDYLVATDAIGMGLNLDVSCVAFADLRKFDGRQARTLDDAELAQIAGRAGRYQTDGRFATLAPLPALSPATTRAIEQHRFPAQERLYWRPHEIDTSSVAALLASLRRRPPPEQTPWLSIANDAEDLRALVHLAAHPEVVAQAVGGPRVALLWEVCQVPDFRQLQLDDHFQLLAALYLQLTGPGERLGQAWVERHVAPLDDASGDIDTLLNRMASIRTWTYVAHRAGWLHDAPAWQARTKAIEDRLSDALHEALVRRFVERRTSVSAMPAPSPRGRGKGGERLSSFAELLRAQVQPEARVDRPAAPSSDRWLEELVTAPHARFRLDDDGRIVDARAADAAPLARLVGGVDLLHPELALMVGADVGPGARLRLHRRLLAWARDLVADLLTSLRAPERDGASLSAAARGVLYQLERTLGTILARDAREQLRSLTPEDRQALRQRGVRLGRHVVFAPRLARPPALRARVALANATLTGPTRIVLPAPSETSLPADDDVPPQLYAAVGYPVFGGRAIRADFIDSIASRFWNGAPANDIASRLGCSPEELPPIRRALGRRD
ncbi:MAG TPA: helicase-related protein, partial [Polyangia bacterium]|nr:helicase-related protein [Polyangia bacterium]